MLLLCSLQMRGGVALPFTQVLHNAREPPQAKRANSCCVRERARQRRLSFLPLLSGNVLAATTAHLQILEKLGAPVPAFRHQYPVDAAL